MVCPGARAGSRRACGCHSDLRSRFRYVGHCLLERDGLARYVIGEVTLQLLECDGLSHRRHFVGHSELIGAWRPRSSTSFIGHAAFIAEII